MKHCSCENNETNFRSVVCDRCNLPLKEVTAEIIQPEFGPGIGRGKDGVIVQFPVSDEDID